MRRAGALVAGGDVGVLAVRRHAGPDRSAHDALGHIVVPGDDVARRLVVSEHATTNQRVIAVRGHADVDPATQDRGRRPREVVADGRRRDHDHRSPLDREVHGPQRVQVAVWRVDVHRVPAAGRVPGDRGRGHEAAGVAGMVRLEADEHLVHNHAGTLAELVEPAVPRADEHGAVCHCRAGVVSGAWLSGNRRPIADEMPLHDQRARVARRDRDLRRIVGRVRGTVQERRPVSRPDRARRERLRRDAHQGRRHDNGQRRDPVTR